MKWYSEDELKKYLGHSITLPLLEQMEYKERRQCYNCPYWVSLTYGYGNCSLKKSSYRNPITYPNDECSEGFAR